MIFNQYQKILSYLYRFIPDRLTLRFSGQAGVERTKNLLQLLNNPQEKLRVIHLAGTSGKGSTAYLISILLKHLGFKVGLQVSPHLLDIRERFQINVSLIPKEEFVKRLTEIIPAIEKVNKGKFGQISFFEILVALAFYIFWKRRVDFVVMETGLGGLYDGTNVVENPEKIAVLTRIGLDHQWILGDNLSKIAFQKAGIIKKNNLAITINQKKSVINVFCQQAKRQKAKLYLLHKNKNFSQIKVTSKGTFFNFCFGDFKMNNLRLNLLGEHQVENCSLALATVYLLSKKYQFRIDRGIVNDTLEKATFPGRCERYKTANRDVIIDGAHNPQKMRAFTKTLKQIYPYQTFDFFLSFSRSKDQVPTLKNMLKYIIPLAKRMTLTNFVLTGQDSYHRSVDLNKIIKILKSLQFSNYRVISNKKKTLEKLIKEDKIPLVITGSLYFIGSLYNNFRRLIKHENLSR